MSNTNEVNILIGVTGSVAAIKLPLLIEHLKALTSDDCRVNIRLVTTESALRFFPYDDIHQLVPVYRDFDDLKWSQIGDEILHIELRKWATIGLIAPLSANTCAKIACGICDNLLTCIVRAWDMKKPLFFAPAMNVHMWEHPITKENIDKLKSFGYTEIPPICKKLACGDVGSGAMAEVNSIVEIIRQLIIKDYSLSK